MYLETARLLHSDIETFESCVVEALSTRGRSLRGGLLSDLRVASFLKCASRTAARLVVVYADENGALAAEVSALRGGGANTGAALEVFFERLADVTRFSNAVPDDDAGGEGAGVVADAEAAALVELAAFTADEVYGRFIDLTTEFEVWANLPLVKDSRSRAAGGILGGALVEWSRVDYSNWLRRIADAHTALPIAGCRATKSYRKHATALTSRLLRHWCRSHPLIDGRDVLELWAKDWEAVGGPAAAAAAAAGAGAGAGAVEVTGAGAATQGVVNGEGGGGQDGDDYEERLHGRSRDARRVGPRRCYCRALRAWLERGRHTG